MAEFVPDLVNQSGEVLRVFNDLRYTLRQMDLETGEVGSRELLIEYQANAAYEPIRIKFLFPESFGTLAAEGLLFGVEGEPSDEVRLALNFLNQELPLFTFYVAPRAQGHEILVRQDVLPDLRDKVTISPKELRHVLTGLCAQKEIFTDVLRGVQEGRSWRTVRDALKALR
jgi:hypothetical protein